jgi:hypothetical protein
MVWNQPVPAAPADIFLKAPVVSESEPSTKEAVRPEEALPANVSVLPASPATRFVTPASTGRQTLSDSQKPVANASIAPQSNRAFTALAAPAGNRLALAAPITVPVKTPTQAAENTAGGAKAPVTIPAAVDSDNTTAQAPNAKVATSSAPAKSNAKSEGNSKSTQLGAPSIDSNRSIIATVAIPGQAPVPLPVAISLPFGYAEALAGKQPDTSAPSAQPESSASGPQSAGIAPAPHDTPNSSSQQTAEDGMRALKGTRTAGVNAPVAGELAFAAKVQPAAASQSSPDSSGRSINETPAVAAPVMRRVTPDADGPRTNESAEIPAVVSSVPVMNISNVPVNNVTTVFQQPDNPASSLAPTASPATERTADLQSPQQTQPPASAAPLKDLSLRIEPPQGQNVEVRVVERAGEVRVAVRGGDSDVIQGLRQNLSELADRLSENGFHAETWRPAASEGSAAPSENKNPSGNSGGGDSPQQQSWSQKGRGQRDQNQSNRPPWVQEFETSLTSGAAPTGSSNGITS